MFRFSLFANLIIMVLTLVLFAMAYPSSGLPEDLIQHASFDVSNDLLGQTTSADGSHILINPLDQAASSDGPDTSNNSPTDFLWTTFSGDISMTNPGTTELAMTNNINEEKLVLDDVIAACGTNSGSNQKDIDGACVNEPGKTSPSGDKEPGSGPGAAPYPQLDTDDTPPKDYQKCPSDPDLYGDSNYVMCIANDGNRIVRVERTAYFTLHVARPGKFQCGFFYLP